MQRLFLPAVLLLALLAAAPMPLSAKDPDPYAADAPLANHLHNLHAALVKYLKAHHQVWPQPPQIADSKAASQWWVDTLKPFGANASDWTDPDDKSGKICFVATQFDYVPNTALRWPTQPWVIMTGKSIHSGRILLVLPDGRVMDNDELMKIAPKR